MAEGSTISLTMSDGEEIAVYHVEPKGERKGGIVLVQEIFGVTDHIRKVSDEYAADGYEVLVPELFHREHPGFAVGYDQVERAVELARDIHPFMLSLADVQTCVDKLAESGKVFIVGYCYGGSIAWFAAARMKGVAAASGYYGSLIPADRATKPQVPIELHFGRNDPMIPVASVEEFIAHKPTNCEVFLYDAGHGFNSENSADYDPESAALARQRTLDLFARHL